METSQYLEQKNTWPNDGKHILADYDENTIVVYQAFRPGIGEFAVKNQYFDGDFSYTRWSWIKTNFLWMMYRSGWGAKPGQEVILRVSILREFFDSLLIQAVESTWNKRLYPTEKEWKSDIARSNVRLQWDPDHTPTGGKLQRRAIQLGLRREALKEYGKNAIVNIEDISHFVSQQRQFISIEQRHQLHTPREEIYCPSSEEAIRVIGLSKCNSS